jgi:hypothetical protein
MDSSHGEDLESGHGIGMREVSYHQKSAPVSSRRAPQRKYITVDPLGVQYSPTSIPLPLSPADDSSVELTPLKSVIELPPHDFFADPGPLLATTVIEPITSLSPEPPEVPRVEQTAVPQAPSEPTSRPSLDDVEQSGSAPQLEPDVTTIRLVGGGGIAGNVDANSFPPEDAEFDRETEPDPDSTTSATSSASIDSVAMKDDKKHEKRKSGLSGLKRLGHLGVLRKKDSRGSVKEMTN